MNKPRPYYANTYHHLYNRGANKEEIFFENGDYSAFLQRIKKSSQKYSIEILAYCLMPNHFHIFAKQTKNDLTIGKFVSVLLNSYTRFINTKYDRSGVLFEGPTKSKLIEDEKYYKWLIKYIIQNPVRAKLVEHPSDWQFSSLNEFIGESKLKLVAEKKFINHFNDTKEFIEFVSNSDLIINEEKFII